MITIANLMNVVLTSLEDLFVNVLVVSDQWTIHVKVKCISVVAV